MGRKAIVSFDHPKDQMFTFACISFGRHPSPGQLKGPTVAAWWCCGLNSWLILQSLNHWTAPAKPLPVTKTGYSWGWSQGFPQIPRNGSLLVLRFKLITFQSITQYFKLPLNCRRHKIWIYIVMNGERKERAEVNWVFIVILLYSLYTLERNIISPTQYASLFFSSRWGTPWPNG